MQFLVKTITWEISSWKLDRRLGKQTWEGTSFVFLLPPCLYIYKLRQARPAFTPSDFLKLVLSKLKHYNKSIVIRFRVRLC